jgi:hypothetical protein
VKWQRVFGAGEWRVVAEERPEKENTVYLRFKPKGADNWKRRSLRRGVRDPRGRLDPKAVADVELEAMRQVETLRAEQELAVGARQLTIAETAARVTDPATGLYPVDTPHRREVLRALRWAVLVWGGDRVWASIRRSELRALWRRRIEHLWQQRVVGHRGAEITVQRILAVAAWLRDEELIPPGACVPSRAWKDELMKDWRELRGERTEPTVHQPRYRLEEYRQLFTALDRGDPRLELAVMLGAELRLGQVARCYRSDVDRTRGLVTVPSRGQKRAPTIELTEGQRAALEHALTSGYLRELEARYTAAGEDFPLFPQGQLKGSRTRQPGDRKHASTPTPWAGVATARNAERGPVTSRTIQKWFRQAEARAGIPHVEGRGTRGMRRAWVDEMQRQNVSRAGQRAGGGWSDNRIPDQVYADQQSAHARREARDARAKARGEEG